MSTRTLPGTSLVVGCAIGLAVIATVTSVSLVSSTKQRSGNGPTSNTRPQQLSKPSDSKDPVANSAQDKAPWERVREAFLSKLSKILELQDRGETVVLPTDSAWVLQLGKLPDVIKALSDIIRDSTLDARVRSIALRLLAEHSPAEARGLVAIILKDAALSATDDRVLLAAIRLAPTLGAVETIADMERLLLHGPSPDAIKRAIITVLPELDRGRAQQILALALSNSDLYALTDSIVKQLARIGTYGAARAVIDIYLKMPDRAAHLDASQDARIRQLLAGLREFPPDTLKVLMEEHLSMFSPLSVSDRNRAVTMVGHLKEVFGPDATLFLGKRFLETSTTPALQSQALALLASSGTRQAADAILDFLESGLHASMIKVALANLRNFRPSRSIASDFGTH